MDSLTPYGKVDDKIRKYDVSEMMRQLFDQNSFMTTAKTTHGRFMTASAIFRGKVSSSEMEMQCISVKNKNSSYFFEWIPSNIECLHCQVPLPG